MLCVANWQMRGRITLIRNYVRSLASSMLGVESKHTIALLCPPTCYLTSLNYELATQCIGHLVHVGAQDCYLGDDGPYTGKINPEMLLDVGVHYVLIGCASEEENQSSLLLQQKLAAAVNAGMQVLFCINGEESDSNLQARLKLLKTLDNAKIVLVCQFNQQGTLNLPELKAKKARIVKLCKKQKLGNLDLIYYGSKLGLDLLAILKLGFSGFVVDEKNFIAHEFAQNFAVCEKFAATHRKS